MSIVFRTLIGLIVAVCAPAHAGTLQIDLREQAKVAGPRLTLGEVADVRGADERTVAELRDVVVGLAPSAGQAVVISRTRMRSVVEHQRRSREESFLWAGAEGVRVETDWQALSGDSYRSEARRFLEEWLAARYPDFSIKAPGDSADLRIRRGAVALRPSLAGAGVAGRMCVLVDVMVGGARERSVPVWFGVSAHKEVMVSVHDLAAGERLDRSQWVLRRVDVAAAGGEVAELGPELARMRLREPLKAGEPVRVSAVERLPAVARGTVVTVVSRQEQVAVTVMATALRDGKVGEVVPVRRDGAKRSFPVRVTGYGTASVDGEGI